VDLVQSAVAATAGEPASEAAAFYAFQLGELHRAAGRIKDADAAFTQALAILPEHVPATAGLARIREAQGRRTEAIELLVAATARLPQPELVAMLGDLYALAGDAAAAERQYALVERISAVAVLVALRSASSKLTLVRRRVACEKRAPSRTGTPSISSRQSAWAQSWSAACRPTRRPSLYSTG